MLRLVWEDVLLPLPHSLHSSQQNWMGPVPANSPERSERKIMSHYVSDFIGLMYRGRQGTTEILLLLFPCSQAARNRVYLRELLDRHKIPVQMVLGQLIVS